MAGKAGRTMTGSETFLSDRLAINDLLVGYCYIVDNRDWDDLHTIFTKDAIVDYSDLLGFRGDCDSLCEFLPKCFEVISATQHNVSNSKVDLHGDSAHAVTVCTNPVVLKGYESQLAQVGLWYIDDLIRTPDGWRIKSRKGVPCYMAGFPADFSQPGKPN